MRTPGARGAVWVLCVSALLWTQRAAGSYPRAQNVTWTSINFKTLLTWGPPPSPRYSYTVQFSVINQDREQNAHCIRSQETRCDLTHSLTQVKKAYIAEVLSEPPRGETSDIVEFPHTRSEPFCPYNDTDIDKPNFKIKEGMNRSVTLDVADPPTALFEGNRQLSIRDVFGSALLYKVLYRRASSTGKKEYISKGREIEVPGLDRDESYCFEVQAYIPSRPSANKQLGALSPPQCSKGVRSFTDDYSVLVIAGGIVLILALVGAAIGLTIVCCKRHSNQAQKEKEGMPLRSV